MIKKKIYTAPETSTVFVVVENILQGLQQGSNGDYNQTITGEEDETDEEGRTNTYVWDNMDDSF